MLHLMKFTRVNILTGNVLVTHTFRKYLLPSLSITSKTSVLNSSPSSKEPVNHSFPAHPLHSHYLSRHFQDHNSSSCSAFNCSGVLRSPYSTSSTSSEANLNASPQTSPPLTTSESQSRSPDVSFSNSSHDLNAADYGSQPNARTVQETSEESESREAFRQVLLESALKHVPRYGWTSRALSAAAEQYDVSPSLAGLFPRREAELVEFFISQNNRRFAAILVDSETQTLLQTQYPRVSQRVTWAVKTRLEMLTQPSWVLSSWPQALAVLARPENAARGLGLLYDIVDEIWHSAVGDQSTGLDWYSKRLTLAAVYASTELYLLADSSPGFQDTWAALDRRIQDAKDIGSYVRGRVELVGTAFGVLKVGLSKTVAAAGAAVNQRQGKAVYGRGLRKERGGKGEGWEGRRKEEGGWKEGEGIGIGFDAGYGRPDSAPMKDKPYTPGSVYGYRAPEEEDGGNGGKPEGFEKGMTRENSEVAKGM